MNRTHGLTMALISLMAIAGCSRKAAPAAPTPADATPPVTTPAGPSTPTNESNAEEEARRERERVRGVLGEMIFFEYDRADLSSDTRATLDRKVPLLRSNADVRMAIEGHADERGSVEYNLALGLRRAAAVRDYLAGFGIAADRLEIQSFGEERPLQAGDNDAAWSRNRRAEFRITGGTLLTAR